VALESALSAINNILGSYNKLKPAAGKAQQRSTNGSSGGQQQQWAAGPSKLVTFTAKAHTSVPVTVSRINLLTPAMHAQCRAGSLLRYQQSSERVAPLCNKHVHNLPGISVRNLPAAQLCGLLQMLRRSWWPW